MWTAAECEISNRLSPRSREVAFNSDLNIEGQI